MLGILQVNEGLNKILMQEIMICGVKFFEVVIYLKNDIKSPKSKRLLKKAFKQFKKQGITEICAHKMFDEYMGVMKYADHFDVFYDNRLQILNTIGKKNIFIYSKYLNKDVLDIIQMLPRKYDNIYLELFDNTSKMQDILMMDYGVSALKWDIKYNNNDRVAVYFDKPDKFCKKDAILNLTRDNFDVSCIYDIECETDLYTGNTDVTAICSALVKLNIDIKIKKIVINAWHFNQVKL